MQNIKELYILGKPISTQLGNFRFVKVKEFDKLMPYISYLNLQKFEIIDAIRKISPEIAKEVKDMSFIDLIKETVDVFEVHSVYKKLFVFLTGEDLFDNIETDEEFEKYRDLIMEMNAIQKEEKNINPEIQKWNNYSKMYSKMKSNGDTSFESIYTSVEAFTGRDVNEMTIYKMYAIFNRISQFKEHDMTVLFRSVSDEVKITPWYKHIDVNKKDEKQLTSLEKLMQSQKTLGK